LAGGGYLGVKTIQTLLARRAAKAAAQAAANAAEPSLSELLARAENSANRASKAIDQAIEGTADDVRNYKDFLKRTTKQNEAWAKTMADRAKMIERAEKGVKAIKKGADVTAEILGNVPGTGTVFKYSYNLSTTAAESIASGDSVGTVALKTTSKGLETAVGDKLFGKITVLDNLPKDLSKSTIKTAFKKVGAENIVTEAVKNEGTNNMMNVMKEIKTRSPFGKIEKGIEKAAKKVDRKFIGKTIKKIFY
jgi:predicted transcriptional regulator